MSNLLTRTLTGVVFVLIVIGSIIWKQYMFSIVFFAVTIIDRNLSLHIRGDPTAFQVDKELSGGIGVFYQKIFFIFDRDCGFDDYPGIVVIRPVSQRF